MNMLDDYVNRKHGKVKVAYDHPLLELILPGNIWRIVYRGAGDAGHEHPSR